MVNDFPYLLTREHYAGMIVLFVWIGLFYMAKNMVKVENASNNDH